MKKQFSIWRPMWRVMEVFKVLAQIWGSGWVRRNFFFSAKKVTFKIWVLLLMDVNDF